MRRSVDILIIGSGVAGLSAAIVARESGLEVVVITKARGNQHQLRSGRHHCRPRR